ncbi:MAG TPA: hypothetical protein DD727_05525 [Clostridiales bacterium]|nr:hypothetical protein [Clostridiales bacterium]
MEDCFPSSGFTASSSTTDTAGTGPSAAGAGAGSSATGAGAGSSATGAGAGSSAAGAGAGDMTCTAAAGSEKMDVCKKGTDSGFCSLTSVSRTISLEEIPPFFFLFAAAGAEE